MIDSVLVYFCPNGMELKLGRLFIDRDKGLQSYSFEFDPDFLSSPYRSTFIDFDLTNVSGRQFLNPGKELFGFLLDALPDRWGKALINRRERIDAKKENRRPRQMFAEDYLLAVDDESRMGCLRFKADEKDEFLSTDKKMSIPPFQSLKDLEYAARMYENDEDLFDETWLKILISPGSSLGGARPKATVKDDNGELWIAKFPSKHDEWDVGAWEMVVTELARLCGLNVPETKLLRLSKYGSTFLTKRFDRNSQGRIPFISAMTALGKTDGETGRVDVSYLDIASFLLAYGGDPSDVKELWKRIVFNITISNGDDHLRNHGFIIKDKHWVLAPAYDLNPSVDAMHLLLTVSEDNNEMDFNLAVDVAKIYGLSKEEAVIEVERIKKTVRENLEKVAKKYGLSDMEIEYMRPAFRT